MSRLDSFIRRLVAQRACLDHAAQLIGGLDGAVLELGLGNGRTYDHLRSLFPGREIEYHLGRDLPGLSLPRKQCQHLLTLLFRQAQKPFLVSTGNRLAIIAMVFLTFGRNMRWN